MDFTRLKCYKDFNTRGWFLNVAWDPIGKVCYAARMGQPAYKCEY